MFGRGRDGPTADVSLDPVCISEGSWGWIGSSPASLLPSGPQLDQAVAEDGRQGSGGAGVKLSRVAGGSYHRGGGHGGLQHADERVTVQGRDHLGLWSGSGQESKVRGWLGRAQQELGMGLAAGWERGWGQRTLSAAMAFTATRDTRARAMGLRPATPFPSALERRCTRQPPPRSALIHLLSGVRRARPRGGAACVAMNNLRPSQPPCAHAHPATASFLRDRPEPRLG